MQSAVTDSGFTAFGSKPHDIVLHTMSIDIKFIKIYALTTSLPNLYSLSY